MNIYVDNFSSRATEKELADLFAQYGDVTVVRVATDRYTGLSMGFAFVEMPDPASAENAIEGLNNKVFRGQTLAVTAAMPENY